ncbi:MAG: YgiQ family radical SAM protein [Candidatus Marinimicrobia bacterium]|nr:YgiQ family radical SAM protein [Candidatus Neomarinimicrobiota bacterium]
MFLPVTREEMVTLGWHALDIILITGDAYIDSPNIGIALLGKWLVKNGYKVGIIAQPELSSNQDIAKLGEPRLFWGVTGGSVDSMVANYTASKKFRKQDDYTPGGINNKRPDRAVIQYVNLIRQHFKNTVPIVLGGIEASLRRITHYDYWSDKLRKPILFDAKADYLLYGMAEKSILELTKSLETKQSPHEIRGLCYISKEPKKGYLELPDFQEVYDDKEKFIAMFDLFYKNIDPLNAAGLIQKIDNRWLVHNPPADYLTESEMSLVYCQNFERAAHPAYHEKIRALDTIRFSVPTHRGCYGECNFCAIAVHEGTRVRWRSEKSIVHEIELLPHHKDWKGYISDLCGPTANMYGYECDIKKTNGKCQNRRCLFPERCPNLKPDHKRQLELLKKIAKIPGVKKVFISSGIRPDLLKDDCVFGMKYMDQLTSHHVSGQLKLAPESTSDKILDLMGKPGFDNHLWFKEKFEALSKKAGKDQYLTYYFIAAHPGCTEQDMKEISHQVFQKLNILPEQVQIFTPTPLTWSSVMYYTEIDPHTGNKIFVEKDLQKKENQKGYLQKRR